LPATILEFFWAPSEVRELRERRIKKGLAQPQWLQRAELLIFRCMIGTMLGLVVIALLENLDIVPVGASLPAIYEVLFMMSSALLVPGVMAEAGVVGFTMRQWFRSLRTAQHAGQQDGTDRLAERTARGLRGCLWY
jgi:hypothetical protein